MSLFVMYLGTRYDVYGFNILRDITICLFYVSFDLHKWPSPFVKVTCTRIIRCILCFWMFVPKLKFVGSVEFEIWTLHIENLNGVTMTSSSTWFQWNSNTNLQRAYVIGISNFILIKHKRAEIQGREVNRELWRKMGITSLWPWPLTQVQ